MKRLGLLSFIFAISLPVFGLRADESERDTHYLFYVGGEYDFVEDKGAPLFGQDWQDINFGAGYVDRDRFSLLYHHRVAGRTDRFDQVLAGELYLKLAKPLWLRTWLGGSPDADFVYTIRSDTELTYYYKNVSFSAAYWFMDYPSTNIHVAAPAFRWFWKRAMLELKYLGIYNTFESELFHAGQIRIQNDFNDRWLRPFAGAAIGEALFGILNLAETSSLDGYLVFFGNKFGLTKDLDWILTFSLAEEDPSFSYFGLGSNFVYRF